VRCFLSGYKVDMHTQAADWGSAVHGCGVSAAAAGYGGASDDEGGARDAWGAMQAADEAEDGSLLSAPRKVPNTGIAYARSSKQVGNAHVQQARASSSRSYHRQSRRRDT
jgi:hypothetical protein